MRYQLFIFLICMAGCKPSPANDPVREGVTGNWFVLYPEAEPPVTDMKKELYAKVQDSLVTAKGLKLISLQPDGQFIQWDSTGLLGKWGLMDKRTVVIKNGGRGFENFRGEFEKTDDGKIKLTEYLNIDGKSIGISWYLYRIVDGKEASLFDSEKNSWRKKPAAPEQEDAIKKRLSSMLKYYSVYFRLIADQSSYFMPVRVMLPLKFYQHAIGMKDFDEKHRFVSLFYSADDAKKAFDLLKETVNNSDYNFPDNDGKSYSKEYSYMLAKLSEEIVK